MICSKRKIVWFNAPHNQNVSTNIAKIFIKLVDKHFPCTHWLHKIFKSNTIKVSCCCMSNVQQLIKKHNNFIQNKKNKTTRSCNWRHKNGCPLNWNCRTENVIYKYTSLMKSNVKKVYYGVSEGEFQKISTTTINNRFKTRTIKTVLLCQHTCGASNLRNKMLIWVGK